ncbi:phosphofurin acidic cluster sorting protein, putative, partial [Ixodes scapularis]
LSEAMGDKSSNKPSAVFVKPVPMKLFAAWEVDKTTPNCIPRQCTFTLTRLLLLKPLGNEVAFITIAVKMQSSKRTLRSNDILLPNTGGLLDTELDLSFSLQYPHFLKGAGGSNKLHVTLQRRKRYKNRAMLGYKTIATGVINMSEVLQRPVGRELELLGEEKERPEPVARIQVEALSTHPVQEEPCDARHKAQDAERSGDNTDDDEDSSSNDDASDSAPEEAGHTDALMRRRRSSQMRKVFDLYAAIYDTSFIASLLVSFLLVGVFLQAFDAEHYPEGLEQELMHKNSRDLEDLLLDELDDLSDSGPEGDNMSLSSTPKPSLRSVRPGCVCPLRVQRGGCSSDRRHAPPVPAPLQQNGFEWGTMPPPVWDLWGRLPPLHPRYSSGAPVHKAFLQTSRHAVATQRAKIKCLASVFSGHRARRRSESAPQRGRARPQGRRHRPGSAYSQGGAEGLGQQRELVRTRALPLQPWVLDQLGQLFAGDEAVPDRLLLVEAPWLATALQRAALPGVLSLAHGADLKAALAALVSRIQKFCNCNSRAPLTVRVGLLGSDPFLHSVVRLYVEHFSTKPPEWQAYLRFFFVPTGGSPVARYLSSVDNCYASLFGDSSWRELVERGSPEAPELADRVADYLSGAHSCLQLPVAEAMVTYKGHSSDDESTQVFIPFISVKKRKKFAEGEMTKPGCYAVDLEEALPGSSPPGGPMERESTTPPSSPSMSSAGLAPAGCVSTSAMDLQLDYWTLGPSARKGAEPSKLTLKAWFRSVQARLHSCSRRKMVGKGVEALGPSLTLNYVTKEKKQKIMRLGKKKERESDRDARCQLVEGVHRLICSCRNLQAPLKVTIDSVEWTGVKFFQLSSQWQTHIKYFPVGLYMAPEHSQSH